jgi:hypothetical protein
MSLSFTSSFSLTAARGAVTRRFLSRLATSVAAAALATGAAVCVALDRTNELYLFHVDRLMHDETILWGPLFLQDTATWQLNRAAIRRPSVLMIGSSRVTQFRESMMPGAQFYNAALATSSLWDAEAYFRTLYPVHKPKTVLLGVDPWWFDAKRDPKPGRAETVSWRFDPTEQVANLLRRADNARELMNMIATPLDRGPDPIGRRTPIGYNAAATASGFRPDGSYQYGAIMLGKAPLYDRAQMGHRYGFRHERDQVRNVAGRFGYTGEASARAAETLRRIVRLHKDAGIELILFFPPVAHAVYVEIQSVPAQRDYFARVTALTRSIAAQGGIAFHEFLDYAKLGVSDTQTIDGIHADEVGSLAQLRAMGVVQ